MKAITFNHLPVSNLQAFEDAAAKGTLFTQVEQSWGQCIRALDACDNIGLVYLFLSDALDACDNIGLVYLFLSDAYKAFITGRDVVQLTALETAIRNVGLNPLIQQYQNPDKFQIVGLDELKPLLVPLNQLAQNSSIPALNYLVLGAGSELYYDCPKVVEAIIRIARRHEREPIFRFDADVVVKEQGVRALINQYERLVNANQEYFFFSGSYFSDNFWRRTLYFTDGNCSTSTFCECREEHDLDR
ncbi:hypothetical protein HYR99_10525 [Candidatus Poribacteria bacterium]|nr:hypothetical protein [Candidatus Poribacteria bacterium]